MFWSGLTRLHGERPPPGADGSQRRAGDLTTTCWAAGYDRLPPEQPIFKEADFDLTRSSMSLGFHAQLLTSNHRFRITTLVQTPGYSASEHWTILQQGQQLQLLEPGHPQAR